MLNTFSFRHELQTFAGLVHFYCRIFSVKFESKENLIRGNPKVLRTPECWLMMIPRPAIVLGIRSANERQRYYVTLSLIGRDHTQSDRFVNGPGQWEAALHSNAASHWPSPYSKRSLLQGHTLAVWSSINDDHKCLVTSRQWATP